MAIENRSIAPHPDFETWTREEVQSHQKELESDISFGSKHGAGQALVAWLIQERSLCSTILAKRNGHIAPAEQQSFWPEPIDAATFLERTSAGENWLWEDALPVASTSMIAGQPRTGKSTLAANLALAISRGARFLGRDTQQAPVLYVSIDNSEPEFRFIVDRLGMVPTDKIYVHTGKVPETKSVEWITEQCIAKSIKFVVIDTFQRFFAIRQINDAQECIDKMSPLDLRAKDLGIHVCYLHHAGKGDPRTGDPTQTAALGSIAIKGMTPWYFQYSRVGTGQRILSSDFRGGRNFDQAYLEIDPKTGWSKLGGNLEDAFITDCVPKVLEFLDDAGQATEGEIRAAIDARSAIVSKAVRRLFHDEQISRSGIGRRGDPFKYFRSNDLNLTPGQETTNVRQIRDYIK